MYTQMLTVYEKEKKTGYNLGISVFSFFNEKINIKSYLVIINGAFLKAATLIGVNYSLRMRYGGAARKDAGGPRIIC